jgi:K+-transporting ATPase A subunit
MLYSTEGVLVMADTERRAPGTGTAIAAAFVLGLEAPQGELSADDYDGVVQRLERAVRPWDSVLDVAPRAVGVLCTTLTNAREVDAVAGRLADVVRAPLAVGDEIHTLGVCVGSATLAPGEEPSAAFARAREAMQHMREARAGLLAPDVPSPRGSGPMVLP